jgi:hypothetical protein
MFGIKVCQTREVLETPRVSWYVWDQSGPDEGSFGNFQNISSDTGLFRFFQYHPMMVNHVHQLVAEVYNGQKVEFPLKMPNLLDKVLA